MDVVGLDAIAPRWEALASVEPDVDRWCTSLRWGRAVADAFEPTWPVIAAAGEESVAAFTQAPHEAGTLLLPLDAVWGFGASVLGVRSVESAAEVARFVAGRSEYATVIGGLVEGSTAWRHLVGALAPHRRLLRGDERVRCRASLQGGLDGWLGRRSREFRRNLRQLERALGQSSVTVEALDGSDPEATLRRLLAIDARSWKGAEGSGMGSEQMTALYRRLIAELASSDGLRVAVARDGEGHDRGYILGGVAGDTYRGLQLAFDEDCRSLGLGNWLQWHELQRLTRLEPHVTTYDLGMDMDYKRRWSEELLVTTSIVVVRS